MKKYALLVAGIALVGTSAQAGIVSDTKQVFKDGVASFKTFKPAAVRAEIGTTGYGGALEFAASDSVDIEIGYASANSVKLVDDLEVKDAEYTVEFEPSKNVFLNAKMRPFKNNFHVTAGVLWQDNQINVSANGGGNDSIKVNGKTYQLGDNSLGDVEANLTFKNEFAPYLGIGFSPSITKRWGLFGEIGAAYIGDTEVSVHSTRADDDTVSVLVNGTSTPTKTKVGEVLTQVQEEIEDKKIASKVLPVAKVGVTVRF